MNSINDPCDDERQPLIPHDGNVFSTSRNTWSSVIHYVLISSVVCLAIFLVAGNNYKKIEKISQTFGVTDVQLVIHREGYVPILSVSQSSYNNDSTTYDIFNGFVGVIEPYSPMIFEVENPVEGLSYSYSLSRSGSLEVISEGPIALLADSSLTSDSVIIPCKSYDAFQLKISAFSSTQETVIESTNSVICMYVRREIRALSPTDLNKTLDTMFIIYSIDEEEGRAQYGNNFHSSKYFIEWHFFNAAQRDGDHIHEGNGFALQHVKATNQFELALQSVDPSLTLPYWDFTVEGQEKLNIYESPIFTSEIFGNCTIPNNLQKGFSYTYDNMLDAAIPNGRWAKLKAEYNTKYPAMNQPYGYLRSPWNMNPNPYISRYTLTEYFYQELPMCSDYVDILNTTSLSDFLFDIAFNPHGTTHSLVGGIMGCELLQPFLDLGYIRDTTLLQLCRKWQFLAKKLYRSYSIKIPTNCTVNSYDFEGLEGCPFICDDAEVVGAKATSIMSGMGFTIAEPYTGTVSNITFFGQFICGGNASRIFEGDHLESASPADPSFWPIHPTLDRVFQLKFLTGGFENNSWSSGFYCQATECYEDNTGNLGPTTECCYGHHPMDQVMDYRTGNRSNHIGATNEDTMKSMDPTMDGSYSLPYIYDHFTWEHCEEAGVSMEEVITQLKTKYLN